MKLKAVECQCDRSISWLRDLIKCDSVVLVILSNELSVLDSNVCEINQLILKLCLVEEVLECCLFYLWFIVRPFSTRINKLEQNAIDESIS